MLPLGSAPKHQLPVHGQDLYCSVTSSISGGACSGLDYCARLYIRTIKLVRGIPVVMSSLRPSTRVSNSSSSAASPDPESSDDYPEIGISTYEGCLIFMVAPNGDPSHHSTSRYPTIGRSEVSDARSPNAEMIQNLNLDFNVVQFQTIMEYIQRMAPEGSPIIALA
jgi:hypothetical protein